MTIVHTDAREFDVTVPVVIVGAGACGLAAALAAKGCGTDAIVLERDGQPRGSTGMSYGAICAAGTGLQREAGIEDDPQQLFEDIMAITHGETDPDLARLIADNAGPAIDWLTERHALRLSVETSWTGLGHRHPRLHAPANRSGDALMGMLLRACERAHADIVTGAKVSALLVDDRSTVFGVEIKRPDGDVEELGCEALVIATCGFGANRDMIREYIPELADARYYGHESNEGDGINWGRALGAAVADMGSYQALGSLATPQSLVMPHTLLIGGGIQVNAFGKRFENELEDISGQALTILDQPDGICWIIYDQRLHEHALDTYQEYRDADEINTAKRAFSWRALADVTALPADSLIDTMHRVESLGKLNASDEFGRTFRKPQALRPPFYAVRVTGALFHTQGGLVVDKHARVKTVSGGLLPNVFAGGGAARSVSGPGGWGYLPGMGLCTAITLGRIAGIAAAALAMGNEAP